MHTWLIFHGDMIFLMFHAHLTCFFAHFILPKIFREFIEGLDLFVGRYLVLIASGYIIVKVIHFKVFPDFP